MDILTGFYIQLVNRNTSRIIFSAATDELTLDAFDRLWMAVGQTISKGLLKPPDTDRYNIAQYELRVEPIFGNR